MFSCSEESVSNQETTTNYQSDIQSSARQLNCPPTVQNIMAGQNYLAGNVTVGNDSDNLYVTYQAAANWYFDELHLFVGNYQDIVLKNGNPAPGQFPYKISFNSNTQMYTFVIPLTQITNIDGCFTVAAHASMRKKNSNGQTIQTETGWSGTSDFPGNNWAKYFNYCLCSDIPPNK